MPKRILILGGVGNGTVIAAAIVDASQRGNSEWEFAGYLNDRAERGELIQGYPVVGRTDAARRFTEDGYFLVNTIYRIDGQQTRIDLFESLDVPEEKLAIFVHPLAYVAPGVQCAPGTVIMPQVSVSPGARFGTGCLIMVGATIGHDTRLGKYCHVAAQSCVGAYTKLEDGVHIGLNATIREELMIGRNATVGMGSVLTKSVGPNEIWVGNPARLLRSAR